MSINLTDMVAIRQTASMSKRTGAQIIWECLVHEDVQTVFGYPGGAILPAYDAMLDYPIRHILVRHEQGGGHAAAGYAAATGRVGVPPGGGGAHDRSLSAGVLREGEGARSARGDRTSR